MPSVRTTERDRHNNQKVIKRKHFLVYSFNDTFRHYGTHHAFIIATCTCRCFRFKYAPLIIQFYADRFTFSPTPISCPSRRFPQLWLEKWYISASPAKVFWRCKFQAKPWHFCQKQERVLADANELRPKTTTLFLRRGVPTAIISWRIFCGVFWRQNHRLMISAVGPVSRLLRNVEDQTVVTEVRFNTTPSPNSWAALIAPLC